MFNIFIISTSLFLYFQTILRTPLYNLSHHKGALHNNSIQVMQFNTFKHTYNQTQYKIQVIQFNVRALG